MKRDNEFWNYLNNLIKENEIIIDRPKGARHHEYTNVVSEFMRAMIIEKNASIENLEKDIHPIENKDNFEVLHFGIHPEYRGRNLGTDLMDYVKKGNKTMALTTDDDAMQFYAKYGYKYSEYYEEINGKNIKDTNVYTINKNNGCSDARRNGA
ncbi:MAG: GNAT family N-acetyltransferase [Treponema sp.]|jgi:ribosomal protein S18 acetylase RimI-like enzyme|nr:GNAT family N-acetyltransferase [Treponema sp.]